MVDLAFQMTQEQTQKLVMTTQMREALSVLEMSGDELYDYVLERAEENVFLEFTPGRRHKGQAKVDSSMRPSVENLLVAKWSLVDEVKHQLRFLPSESPEVQSAALRLTDDLDENGYLTPYNPETGHRLGLNEQQFDAAVHRIQRCEPTGVGARSLKECLWLQIDSIAVEMQPLVQAMIQDHLEDLASGRLGQVARQLKVSTEDVLSGMAAIRTLNPRPGASYGGEATHYIRPDLSVVRTESGFTVVVLDALADMTWQNTAYQQMMRGASEDVRHYLAEQLREARWIRRCVVQRTLTLQRIGDALVQLQPEFLDHGFESLRPMRLCDVADILDVHESTVSRAIRNKTLATPTGLVELKQLFSATLHGAAGDVSAAAIKHQMREWVKSEPADAPLTDAVIAKRFLEEGIKVSRRTVAKYREAMGIAGSATRRMQAEVR